MEILSWILTIILVISVFFFFYFRRFRGSIEESGLPMVRPFLCFGSAPILYNKIIYHVWYHEKHKELGRSFTRYEGNNFRISTRFSFPNIEHKNKSKHKKKPLESTSLEGIRYTVRCTHNS